MADLWQIYGHKWLDLWLDKIVSMAMAIVSIPGLAASMLFWVLMVVMVVWSSHAGQGSLSDWCGVFFLVFKCFALILNLRILTILLEFCQSRICQIIFIEHRP